MPNQAIRRTHVPRAGDLHVSHRQRHGQTSIHRLGIVGDHMPRCRLGVEPAYSASVALGTHAYEHPHVDVWGGSCYRGIGNTNRDGVWPVTVPLHLPAATPAVDWGAV